MNATVTHIHTPRAVRPGETFGGLQQAERRIYTQRQADDQIERAVRRAVMGCTAFWALVFSGAALLTWLGHV